MRFGPTGPMGGGQGVFTDGNGQTFIFQSSGGLGGMGGSGGLGSQGMDPYELFSQLFGDDDMMGGFGGLQGRRRGRRANASDFGGIRTEPDRTVTHKLKCSLD